MLERRIIHGENLEVLRTLPAERFGLIYIDPPFNTGRKQVSTRLEVFQDEAGDRTGFKGRRYRTEVKDTKAYPDRFDDFLGFLEARLREAKRLLTADGSLFVHVDPRESHYVKLLLDRLYGRDSFMNEIIWSYDYGGRPKNRWPSKHDVIFWYANDPEQYVFDYDAIDRIPYMAPSLVGAEKAARGKTPTDVWWNTIVPTTSKERTGYPTQKPLSILERIVCVHSKAGDTVLDFFAGSGTTGEAAARHGRGFVLVDENPEAIAVMGARLAAYSPSLEVQGAHPGQVSSSGA